MELKKPLATLKVSAGMSSSVADQRVTVTAGKQSLTFEVRVAVS